MTHIEIPPVRRKISAGAGVLLVGSCFADEVGERMARGGFDVMANPFGTLYNPASIAVCLHPDGQPSAWAGGLVFQDGAGVWHSWMHHSRFSADSAERVWDAVCAAARDTRRFLLQADTLVVTLGTAVVYRLRETGMLVANCHKMPDTLFVRERLTVEEIVDEWTELLEALHAANPSLRVVFTVSPVRHKRDGFHVNQISKGILLAAVDRLLGQCPAGMDVSYFPAYEIVLDELRDYRFYAADMIHPSDQAVGYVWQRFQDTYLDPVARTAVAEAERQWKRANHRQIVQAGGEQKDTTELCTR